MLSEDAQRLVDELEAGRSVAGADLSHIDFAELKLIDWSGRDLRRVVMRGSRRPAVVAGRSGVWSRLISENPHPRWADFRAAGADLTWADLHDADLRHAVLVDATLLEADLRDADLSGADLSGADLTGAVLDGTRIEGLRWDAATRWPEGFTPPPCPPR